MRNWKMRRSWPLVLLWAHALGVAGFYVVAWLRTAAPGQAWRVPPVPPLPGRRSNSSAPISATILVPARNEERTIERCVTSLLEQDYGEEAPYEVIAIDDGSTDG